MTRSRTSAKTPRSCSMRRRCSTSATSIRNWGCDMDTQARIAQELKINRLLGKGGEGAELQRRIDFIKGTLRESGCQALVLGISGGVDSLTAGRLCQLAVEQLRHEDYKARFIPMRLPYKTQADERDARASLDFIAPDRIETLNIAACVDGLMGSLSAVQASAER